MKSKNTQQQKAYMWLDWQVWYVWVWQQSTHERRGWRDEQKHTLGSCCSQQQVRGRQGVRRRRGSVERRGSQIWVALTDTSSSMASMHLILHQYDTYDEKKRIKRWHFLIRGHDGDQLSHFGPAGSLCRASCLRCLRFSPQACKGLLMSLFAYPVFSVIIKTINKLLSLIPPVCVCVYIRIEPIFFIKCSLFHWPRPSHHRWEAQRSTEEDLILNTA